MRTANYDTAAKKPPVRLTGPCLGNGVTEIGVVCKLAAMIARKQDTRSL